MVSGLLDPAGQDACLGMPGSGEVRDPCRFDPDEAENLFSDLPEECILVNDAHEPIGCVGRDEDACASALQ